MLQARLTLRDAEVQLGNDIYKAASLLEELEGKETIGNGHHMRQTIVRAALQVLRAHWHDKDEVAQAEPL